MTSSLTLRIFTNYEEDFYQIMGPFFASREFVNEMGGWQFFTKPKATWFVLFEDEKVVGFCSLFHEPKFDYLDNLFIIPDQRGKKYSKLLLKAVLETSKQTINCITNNPIQAKSFLKCGFEEVGKRGSFIKFTLGAR
jgi:RimJ/RimL family protein N-acetyltransferase